MPLFRYRGYDAAGVAVSGEMAGATLDEAERRLDALRICLVSLEAVLGQEAEGASRPVRHALRRLTDGDAAVLIGDLAVMAESGVPFAEALEAVASGTRDRALAEALRGVRSAIGEGRSLSEAIASADRLFPPMVAEMVAVAEEGGNLAGALHAAAEHLERSSDLRKSILQAMLYPIVMSCVAFTAIGVLVLFVLPRFADVLGKMGAELPTVTRWLLAAGAAVRNHPIEALAVAAAVAAAIAYGAHSESIRCRVLAVARRAPFVGPFMRRLALARAFQSISTLLATNVPLVRALEHGAHTAGDAPIGAALSAARRAVEQGCSLAEALAASPEFPPVLVRMAAVGEKSGRLASLTAACARSLAKDADRKLKSAVSILEPMMIVLMGLIVGILTISVVAPIYSVAENIK